MNPSFCLEAVIICQTVLLHGSQGIEREVKEGESTSTGLPGYYDVYSMTSCWFQLPALSKNLMGVLLVVQQCL
jgi:hypothetical protein